MGVGRESIESRVAKIESVISQMVESRDEYSVATAFFMSESKAKLVIDTPTDLASAITAIGQITDILVANGMAERGS